MATFMWPGVVAKKYQRLSEPLIKFLPDAKPVETGSQHASMVWDNAGKGKLELFVRTVDAS